MCRGARCRDLFYSCCLRSSRAGVRTLWLRATNWGGPNTATIASGSLRATPPQCLPRTAARPRGTANSMRRQMGKPARRRPYKYGPLHPALISGLYRKAVLSWSEGSCAPIRGTWTVLSGTIDGTMIYEKAMFSCGEGLISTFAMTYPVAERRFYDRIVENRLASSVNASWRASQEILCSASRFSVISSCKSTHPPSGSG